MTTELQRAMARYEEARIGYQKTVLASLQGQVRGDAIRQAIREIQSATSDLRRAGGSPPRPGRPARRQVTSTATPAFAFFRRLLSTG